MRGIKDLIALGVGLGSTYELDQDITHLDRAIEAERAAWQLYLDSRRRTRGVVAFVRNLSRFDSLVVSDAAVGARVRANLSVSLMVRHSRLRSMSDLDEAIGLAEDAVAQSRTLAWATANGWREFGRSRAMYLSTLSHLLVIRHRRRASPSSGDELERAVEHLKEAWRMMPARDAEQGTLRLNFARALTERARFRRDHAEGQSSWEGDVTRALELLRFDGRLDEYVERTGDLAAVVAAEALQLRHDFGTALSLMLATWDVLDRASPRLTEVLMLAAASAEGLAATTGAERSPELTPAVLLTLARRLWATAALHRGAPPTVTLEAARRWLGRTAQDAPGSGDAAEAGAAAVQALTVAAWYGLDRRSQEQIILDAGRTTADAVACAVAAGRPGSATGLSDLGRSVLWAQFLDRNSDITDLEARNAALAARLTAVRGLLNEPVDFS
jgi:hypothetical protein